MSGISYEKLKGDFVPGFIIQVPPGDTRIGNGTNYGIALTAQQIEYAFSGVKNWTVATTGITDWWNSGSLQLPGGSNYLPNNNVWSSLAGNQPTGSFIYTGQGTLDNTIPPQFVLREQYAAITPLGNDVPCTTGFDGGNVFNLPDVGIDLASNIYWDGTSYYPKIFVRGGADFSTDKSVLGASPQVLGLLSFLGQTTNIYKTNGSGFSGSVTWTDAQRW